MTLDKSTLNTTRHSLDLIRQSQQLQHEITDEMAFNNEQRAVVQQMREDVRQMRQTVREMRDTLSGDRGA